MLWSLFTQARFHTLQPLQPISHKLLTAGVAFAIAPSPYGHLKGAVAFSLHH